MNANRKDSKPSGNNSSGAATFRQSLSLLFTRRFGTFFFASFLSNIGTWAQQVAEPWLLLSIGASPFLIGLDTFALGGPVLVLTLFGGVLADTFDRRRVIAVFQSIQMLCPIALVALLLIGAVKPWMVICLSVVVGITDALSMPSFQSIVPFIVRRDQIAPALALNSTQFNLSRILGPAIAGALMASVGAIWCFGLSAASYLPFIGVALWILPPRIAKPPKDDRIHGTRIFSDVRDVIRHEDLRGALLAVVTTSVLCGPLMTFCPVLVKEAFQGSVTDFSLAIAIFGAGGLAGAAWLLAMDPRDSRRGATINFALAYAAVVMLAAVNPWFWGLAGLLFLGGLAMTASNISANAILQSTAPPHLIGQATSLYMLAMRGGISVGSLLTGALVDHIGIRTALLVNGAVAAVIHILIRWRWAEPGPAVEA